MGQVQKGAEPLLLALAEHLHVNPRVGTADDRADGYGDDVQQLVPLAPVNPGILQSPKTLHDRHTPPLLHGSPHPPSQPRSLNTPSLSAITRLPCGELPTRRLLQGADICSNTIEKSVAHCSRGAAIEDLIVLGMTAVFVANVCVAATLFSDLVKL